MDSPLLQLSQGHLKLLHFCPRKYQYTYLDQLFIPTIHSKKEAQERLGRQFHLLMQQHWMGLDIAPTLAASPPLQQRFQVFQDHPPELIEGDRFTEHRRMLKLGSFLLVGIFDLLAINATAGQIIDWKTYQKPQSLDPLRQSWQTKLYLYLLAETSDLSPEQISMTYWFSETLTEETSHEAVLDYSQAQHQQTHQQLSSRLAELEQWQDALSDGQPFPQVEEAEGHCYRESFQCPFLVGCQRSPQQLKTEALLNIQAIPEIPLPSDLNNRSDQAR